MIHSTSSSSLKKKKKIIFFCYILSSNDPDIPWIIATESSNRNYNTSLLHISQYKHYTLYAIESFLLLVSSKEIIEYLKGQMSTLIWFPHILMNIGFFRCLKSQCKIMVIYIFFFIEYLCSRRIEKS